MNSLSLGAEFTQLYEEPQQVYEDEQKLEV